MDTIINFLVSLLPFIKVVGIGMAILIGISTLIFILAVVVFVGAFIGAWTREHDR